MSANSGYMVYMYLLNLLIQWFDLICFRMIDDLRGSLTSTKAENKVCIKWNPLKIALLAASCCQLSQITRKTPDFGPYLPVSRLESDISWIIAKVAASGRLDFPTVTFQMFCVVWATVNMERFLINFGMPL